MTIVVDQSQFNDAFWKWFGDSKVVDANGDPLIVYRGQRRIPSPTRFATTLGRATASFTAIPELANVYAKTRDWFGSSADFGKGANVGAYYLSIQNPADLRVFGPQANLGEMLSSLFLVDLSQDRTEGQTFGQDDFVQVITGLASRANKTTFFFESDILESRSSWLRGETDRPSEVADDLSDHEGDEDVFTFYFDNIEVDVFALADSKNFTALLKRAGYDGIFHQDVGQLAVEFLERPPAEIPGIGKEPDYAFDTFRPFAQTQVKSATGNRGTWSREDPDVTHNPPESAPDIRTQYDRFKAIDNAIGVSGGGTGVPVILHHRHLFSTDELNRLLPVIDSLHPDRIGVTVASVARAAAIPYLVSRDRRSHGVPVTAHNPSYPNPVNALRDILGEIQEGKQPGLYDFGQVLRWLDIALTGRTMKNMHDYARSAELMLEETRGEFYLSDGGYSRVWMDLDEGRAWVTDNSTAEVKRRWKALAEDEE